MSDDIFDFDIDAELAKAEEKAAQKVKRSLSSSKTKRTAKVARSDRLTHKTAAAVFISERRAVSIQHESPDEERRHQNQAKCGHRHQYFPQNVFSCSRCFTLKLSN